MTDTKRAGLEESPGGVVLLRRAAIAVLRAAEGFAEAGDEERAARLDLLAAWLLQDGPDDDEWQRTPAVMCGSEDTMP
ncbi:hypothetical protein BAY61_27475 [Prauserella marina]|uniref:Uncharacterized protein n=1 Tax=Prauserella marina TaxID=530584 RepID=A0A222VW23_9PSEU|nr:hypothetical protein [Prauserella marina]ASR38129.1 hypothetical protein BAY61_27475 [Prauserella marina]PWV78708.1 hypothetical protein DES30_104445 [Prauserella marina]SDC91947.1 hypothetical protein SAMN05421630_104444 [Prauserella marina]